MLSKQSKIKLDKIVKCREYNTQIDELIWNSFNSILDSIFSSFGGVKEYIVGNTKDCYTLTHGSFAISADLIYDILHGQKLDKDRMYFDWVSKYHTFVKKLQWNCEVRIYRHKEILDLIEYQNGFQYKKFSIDDFKTNNDVNTFYEEHGIGAIYNFLEKCINRLNDFKLFTISFKENYPQKNAVPMDIGIDITANGLKDSHFLDRVKNPFETKMNEAFKILRDLEIYNEKVAISFCRNMNEKAKNAFKGFKYEYMGCKPDGYEFFTFYNRKEQKFDFDCESVLKFDSKDNSRLYLRYISNVGKKDRLDNIYMLIQTNDGKGVCKEYLTFIEYDEENILANYLSQSFFDAIYDKAERMKDSVSTAQTF